MSVSLSNIKRILIGKPFPTRAEIHERLDKVRALAIFASDPISSNAYATEAIMAVLLILGTGALSLTLPVALGIMALVLLVIFSYTQTILHYPTGGGSYIVTKDNLGTSPSLVAAAALLIDYILTVSVSVSAGVRAVTSAFPATFDYRVMMALTAILLLTWINLRGVRESGSIFALPTYAFVVGVILVVLYALARQMGLLGAPLPTASETVRESLEPVTQTIFIWYVLRAFAAGCTALTGIEAISDGVQAFKPPEAKNAAKTMIAMGIIAMALFMGITYVSTHLHLIPSEEESILSQMTRLVTGGGFLYYWVQIFTMLILFLAANTGFQDFPRVSSFLAKDGFMPRWMQNRGDRLVFNGGIITLAVLASLLVLIFQADEIAMLPLYALGVMLSFTLSQFSMARLMGRIAHLKPGQHLKTSITEVHYEKGVWWKRSLNVIGGITTFIVLIILIATKFMEGAWVIVVAIPLLVLLFRSVRRHYENVAEALTTRDLALEDMADIGDVVIVPIADVHRGTIRALRYARRISTDVRAVCILTNPEQRERLERRWTRFPEVTHDLNLVCIDYEYRDIISPLVEYIEYVNNVEFPDKLITVVVPEFIPKSLGERLLHNQTANFLRFRLQAQEDVVVIDVPFHV